MSADQTPGAGRAALPPARDPQRWNLFIRATLITYVLPVIAETSS
jgi:hypothetical protein